MKTQLVTILTIGLMACGHSKPTTTTATTSGGGGGGAPTEPGDAPAKHEHKPSDAGTFQVNDTEKSSRPAQGKLQATATEAAVRFFVVDQEKGPIKGIAISLTSPTGKKYYAEETDADGFAELLLPIGQTYELTYLSLGRHNVAAKVDVANKPNLNLKLTMRYKSEDYPKSLVLDRIEFASGKATLIGESQFRLDAVVEYMTHKKSAVIEISGHTDNVGDKAANKTLSQKRAEAVRDYLISKGIDGDRLKAVGYGDTKPIAPNTTDEGRQKNRRIEANEL